MSNLVTFPRSLQFRMTCVVVMLVLIATMIVTWLALVLAERVVLLIDGRLDDDFRVDLPRPRRRGDPHLAALKEQLLDRLHQADASH